MSPTTKDRILAVIEKLDEDTSIDVAIHRLVLLKKLDQSRKQIAQGKGVDHDEMFDRLLTSDEKHEDPLVAGRGKRSGSNTRSNRSRQAKGGENLRRPAKKVHK